MPRTLRSCFVSVQSLRAKQRAHSAVERLLPKWTSPVYAFYEPVPEIEYVEQKGGGTRTAFTFVCYNKGCSKRVRRYLDTSDKMSTSNLLNHALSCWGKPAVDAAKGAGSAKDARKSVATPLKRDGDIKLAFERKGQGKITYSTRQYTKTETRYRLMKTGRPEQYIPSRSTVSRDLKSVFVRTRKRIAKMLQDHDGDLSFQTDCWTSPNHKAYMGTTVTLEHNGSMMTFVLDIVEVPKVLYQRFTPIPAHRHYSPTQARIWRLRSRPCLLTSVLSTRWVASQSTRVLTQATTGSWVHRRQRYQQRRDGF
ncbi:hypothetical protein GGG16DRAFT_67949 [Schizophyllum commune]